MFNDKRPRRVVPRWRSSWITGNAIEARSNKRGSVSAETRNRIDAEVSDKVREFELMRSIPVAAELMFTASMANNKEVAKAAAKLIFESRDQIGSRQLVRSAQQILQEPTIDPIQLTSREFVPHARALLSIDYANPVLLMDVARELTALRQDKGALRYVRAAVALAPNSRFVIRSAARYYLHIGEVEIAHDLLLRSPLIKRDPWVQASEIAVATVRGRTSTFAKQVIRVLGQAKQVGADATELASAVGTIELLNGSEKKAKLLFQHALSHPNDNSLAQAEWAASRLKLVVDIQALSTPLSFEANSHNAYRHQEIDEALQHAILWAGDEPFASRPLEAQCHLLCLQERYSEALTAANGAYVLSRDGLSAELNLLFCKTQTGNFDDAMEGLARLSRNKHLKQFATHYLANAGAIAYAMGEFEMARKLYQRAIHSARVRNEPYSEALAIAFFARIATRAGDPQAESIVQDAVASVPKLPNPGAIYVVRGLVDPVTGSKLDQLAASRVKQPKWQWDAISNTLHMLDT